MWAKCPRGPSRSRWRMWQPCSTTPWRPRSPSYWPPLRMMGLVRYVQILCANFIVSSFCWRLTLIRVFARARVLHVSWWDPWGTNWSYVTFLFKMKARTFYYLFSFIKLWQNDNWLHVVHKLACRLWDKQTDCKASLSHMSCDPWLSCPRCCK